MATNIASINELLSKLEDLADNQVIVLNGRAARIVRVHGQKAARYIGGAETTTPRPNDGRTFRQAGHGGKAMQEES